MNSERKNELPNGSSGAVSKRFSDDSEMVYGKFSTVPESSLVVDQTFQKIPNCIRGFYPFPSSKFFYKVLHLSSLFDKNPHCFSSCSKVPGGSRTLQKIAPKCFTIFGIALDSSKILSRRVE